MTEIKDNIYNHSCNDNSGNLQNLSAFEGQALLIVNTASKCGFTPQYNGLQELQEKFKDSGFSVLAFPCNQFGGQEPGSSEEIQEFCTVNYGINFPIFEKVDVKGEDAHPLFKYLTSEKKGLLGSESIKWNFTKFLINKEGKPIARFAPNTTPEKISKEIENLLKD
ncbi:glutathione peroxidase [Gammaproteobacteria bacterium]|jgi:glutathione peroxidase|nr:glutathione peroxidase [Gammaproteobacteria bacterium]MDC0028471.1 glutathione peroxidase [Gammaproteobacteria bacterium]|tara:strand:- start:303 stop:800 length:498 start_codon:yes stop_codon:yes gene_type:complete